MGKVSNANCSVFGCHTRRGRETNVHFHKYPPANKSKVEIMNNFGQLEKIDRRQAWIIKLKMGKPVGNSMAVCSKHFTKEDYYAGGVCWKKPKLKLTAIPSLYLPSNKAQSNKVKTKNPADSSNFQDLKSKRLKGVQKERREVIIKMLENIGLDHQYTLPRTYARKKILAQEESELSECEDQSEENIFLYDMDIKKTRKGFYHEL